MKKLLSFYFISVFSSIILFAQQKYHLDYLLHYKHEYITDSVKKKDLFFMANSEDNSYRVEILNLDKDSLRLNFTDFNCTSVSVTIHNKHFQNAEYLTIPCKSILKINYRNTEISRKTKHYQFVKIGDTLIYNESFVRYKYEPINRKRALRRKTGTFVYTFDTSGKFKKPFFFNPIVYLSWSYNKIPINDLFIEAKFYDFKGIYRKRYLIEGVRSINKYVIIPEECKCLKE